MTLGGERPVERRPQELGADGAGEPSSASSKAPLRTSASVGSVPTTTVALPEPVSSTILTDVARSVLLT
jgi:hypothetical protein